MCYVDALPKANISSCKLKLLYEPSRSVWECAVCDGTVFPLSFVFGSPVVSYLSITQLVEDDQKVYRRFNVVVSDRWQAEMMGEVLPCCCVCVYY